MRASIGHLTRNIKIQVIHIIYKRNNNIFLKQKSLENEDLWGVHIMIGAYNEENEDGITELDILRRGVARFTGVEINHCA